MASIRFSFLFIAVLCIQLSQKLFAQKVQMKELWKSVTQFDVNIYGIDEELKIVWSCDKKDMQVSDFDTGTRLWRNEFSNISSKIKSINTGQLLSEAKCFMITKSVGYNDAIVGIDILTGKEMWSITKFKDLSKSFIQYIPEITSIILINDSKLYCIDAKTGNENWIIENYEGIIFDYCYDKDEDHLLFINYDSPIDLIELKQGEIIKLSARDGKLIWKTKYKGKVDKIVVSEDNLNNFGVQNRKFYLFAQGLQVFDYQTGIPVWEVMFDFPNVVVFSEATYTIASPLFVDEFVYLFEFHKKDGTKFIRKYNTSTGKLIWSYSLPSKSKIIPVIVKKDGKIIIQVGGLIQLDFISYEPTRGIHYPYVRKVGHDNFGASFFQVLDDNTGNLIWSSDDLIKFQNKFTNIFVSNENIFASTKNELCSINVNTGKVNYSVPLNYSVIDNAIQIFDDNENVIVWGEEGLSLHSKETGKHLWSFATENGKYWGSLANTGLFTNIDSEIFIINMKTGKGFTHEASNDSFLIRTKSGEFLFLFDNDHIFKYKLKDI